MARRSLQAALLLAVCCTALGLPAWYNCGPDNCSPPDCQCAGWLPPTVNGTQLAPKDIPQFIHDDAITAATNEAVRSIIDGHSNRNGCNMPATFFVLELNTDCNLAKAFWEQNSEMAIHSKTHVPLVDPFPGGPEAMKAEMFSARQFLNTSCGIPLEDMVGFRAPQLVHNPPVRQALEAEGMLYDSSIIDFFGPEAPTSPNASYRLWPYTMDQGIPQDCTYFTGDNCTQQERYPGLWEVPLLEMQSPNGSLLYAMDVGLGTGAEYGGAATFDLNQQQLQELITFNFNSSYNNNRAPFGLYIHTPWISAESVNATNAFLDWALALPDTYVVTMRQVIEWMKDPVPVSQMDDWLTCNPVDLSEAPGVTKCQVYTVKEGDNGSDIASNFGVSLQDLAAQNGNVNSLAIGQVLHIPPFDASCGKGIPVTAPGTPAPAPTAA